MPKSRLAGGFWFGAGGEREGVEMGLLQSVYWTLKETGLGKSRRGVGTGAKGAGEREDRFGLPEKEGSGVAGSFCAWGPNIFYTHPHCKIN